MRGCDIVRAKSDFIIGTGGEGELQGSAGIFRDGKKKSLRDRTLDEVTMEVDQCVRQKRTWPGKAHAVERSALQGCDEQANFVTFRLKVPLPPYSKQHRGAAATRLHRPLYPVRTGIETNSISRLSE